MFQCHSDEAHTIANNKLACVFSTDYIGLISWMKLILGTK